MPSWELRLISRILEEKSTTKVINRGITPEMLKNNILAMEIFKTVNRYRMVQGSIPSVDYIKHKFPEYEHVVPEEPTDILCDLLLDGEVSRRLQSGVREAIGYIDTNPRRALMDLQQTVNQLTRYTVRNNDINLREFASGFKEEYEKYKELNGMFGLPYPWPALNTFTGGMRPENLIVMYGSSKSCKSWLLLYTMLNLYIAHNKKVLVISKEMSPFEIARRSIALVGKLPYSDFQTGRLTAEIEQGMYSLLGNLSSEGNFIISDARSETGEVSVSTVMNKAEAILPDIIAIDAAYLLSDGRGGGKYLDDSKRVMHITQDLKELAQRMKIPVFVTTQANRYGSRLSKDAAVGFSISFLQDADLIMSILRKHKEDEIAIKIDANREGVEDGLTIQCKLAEDLSQKSSSINNLVSFMLADKAGPNDKHMTEEEKEDHLGMGRRRRKPTDSIEGFKGRFTGNTE